VAMQRLKIGDFSQLGQVSIRTLRYYDQRGLLKPAHIDGSSDYRYYDLSQLPRLNRILALKDLGLSLDQIVSLLEEDLPAERLRRILAEKQAEIARQVAESKAQLARVEARLRQIVWENEPSPYDVALKSVDAMCAASIRAIAPTAEVMGMFCYNLHRDLYQWLSTCGVQPLEPEMMLYHNDSFTEVDIDTEAAVPIPAKAVSKLEHALPDARYSVKDLPAVDLMATTMHQGPLPDIALAVYAVFSWAFENGYQPYPPAREVHVKWCITELSPSDNYPVVEVQLPIKPSAE